MPQVRHKKKVVADKKEVDQRTKVVSAYSEEGKQRNLEDAKRSKRLRMTLLVVSIVLILTTIASTILILKFASGS